MASVGELLNPSGEIVYISTDESVTTPCENDVMNRLYLFNGLLLHSAFIWLYPSVTCSLCRIISAMITIWFELCVNNEPIWKNRMARFSSPFGGLATPCERWAITWPKRWAVVNVSKVATIRTYFEHLIFDGKKNQTRGKVLWIKSHLVDNYQVRIEPTYSGEGKTITDIHSRHLLANNNNATHNNVDLRIESYPCLSHTQHRSVSLCRTPIWWAWWSKWWRRRAKCLWEPTGALSRASSCAWGATRLRERGLGLGVGDNNR